MAKAVVLSSGGIDSTTCLALAIKIYGKENVSALSIYYGQKHDKELECARKVAEYYSVNHYEANLSEAFKFSDCTLLKQSKENIPEGSYADQISLDEKVSTYVPFRNGLFLSFAASLALSIYPDDEVKLYYGAHADDYAKNAYADCSPEFNKAIKEAVYLGTYKKVEMVSPLINLNKTKVVEIGLNLNAPYELTWSCYNGKEKACGKCATCIDRLKAFKDNNTEDPIEYDN